MCGIAGMWGCDGSECLTGMLERLAHRGPDGQGTCVIPEGSMGCVRLAIMDPDHGKQPLYNEDRSMALVANCAIYNYPALKSELSRRHCFSTGNDAEAVLHLFEELGNAAFGRMRGMFAIAIADQEHLVLARDHIGIKPLYYGWNGKTGSRIRLRFASELKALVDSPDPVRALPPGHLFDSRYGLVEYYELPLPEESPSTAEVIASRLRDTLGRSVADHLMSDVPVGAFLSGGLDSSIIVSLMRPLVRELHTFCVGTAASEDIALARVVAERLNTTHHEHLLTEDEVVNELPQIAYHLESFDRYMVSNAIPDWFCSKLAAQYVKVALVGEGADEIFAGYEYHSTFIDNDTLRQELHRNAVDLHQLNLQRVDRIGMAHGLECRVPFVTPEVFEMGLAIPGAMKIRVDRGASHSKWILRRAFDGVLPDEIIWGRKRNFDEGSGGMRLVKRSVSRAAGDFPFAAYKREHRDAWLRRVEEVWFHKLLTDEFGDSRVIFDNTARWGKLRLRERHHRQIGKRPIWKLW